MNTDLILQETASYVKQLYNFYSRPYLLYHNLSHTNRVVKHADEIAQHYKLDDNSRFVLLAAAWFHDTGQLNGDMPEHEQRSVQFMKEFFSNRKIVHTTTIDEIAQCIMATKMPVAPTTLLEKIICDADTWHLGTKDFQAFDTLVWEELELRTNNPIENKLQSSLNFLKAHQFFTFFCQQKLLPGKNENIAQIKDLL